MWFSVLIDEKAYSPDEMHELILLYLSRFDEEMEEIQSQQRPGRPIPKRLDELNMTKKQELDEYKKGFVLPDLSELKNVQILKAWNGDYNSIKHIKQLKLVASKE